MTVHAWSRIAISTLMVFLRTHLGMLLPIVVPVARILGFVAILGDQSADIPEETVASGIAVAAADEISIP